MLNTDAWHMQLITYASQPYASQRPAIRQLYYAGYEVEWIADTCMIPVETVRDAILRIP